MINSQSFKDDIAQGKKVWAQNIVIDVPAELDQSLSYDGDMQNLFKRCNFQFYSLHFSRLIIAASSFEENSLAFVAKCLN